MKNYLFYFLLISLCCGCTDKAQQHNPTEETGVKLQELQKKKQQEAITIDFKNPQAIKSSEIIADRSFIKLETVDESLFGNIKQIEIFNDHIYIMDIEHAKALLVYTMDGKFVKKLAIKGVGPGEFLYPHSFKIDPKGFLYLYDNIQSKLIKYQLSELKFLEEIPIPYPSPLSFTLLENNEFLYYYPIRAKGELGKRQLVHADKEGHVMKIFHEGALSGKILHGHTDNSYQIDNELRMYLYFSDKVYRIENDSLILRYQFKWGKYTIPDEDIFENFSSSGDVMKRLFNGNDNWVRFMYVFETEPYLFVKYYIQKDMYLSGWDKQTNKVFNAKKKDIIDDIGLGGVFPFPVGVYDNKMIGVLYPHEMEFDKVSDEKLKPLMDDVVEDSNAILVIYNLKNSHE